MATIEEIINYYRETGNFMKTAVIFNMNKRILHLTLAKAGVLKINDKIDFGTTNMRKGGLAEKKFKEIFPEAIPTNACWQMNHPGYDFDLQGLRIDVKYSSIRISKAGTMSWGTRGNDTEKKKKNPVDFFVLFLERGKSTGMEKAHILAVPGGMVKTGIAIFTSGDLFNEFRMEDEEELREYLLSYAELIGG
ncbi:hypothetical protein AB9M75_08130 [Lactobacillus sp. AN1001]